MSDENTSPSYASMDDLQKIELRVGKIVTADRVEGSKGGKLLRLTVDFGEPSLRTVVSGIGLTFSPDQLINKQYAFVTNLAPLKMMGIESQAMILAAGTSENLSLCQITGMPVNGAKLG